MTKKSKVNKNRFYGNRNSRIVTNAMKTRAGTRTHTVNRDDGTLNASAVTSEGRTTLKLYDCWGRFIELSGTEARTVFRTLQKHYDTLGV